MRMNLGELLTERSSRMDVDTEFVPDFTNEAVAVLPDDVTLTSPVRIRGQIVNGNGYMTMDAEISADYLTRCDRCLDEVRGTMTFPFRRLIVYMDRTGVKLTEDDGVDPDDLLRMTDSYLDAEPAIMEQLVCEMPYYHLCRDDCPGLCPRCGKKLADGDCGCRENKEIDPRLAILKKLLDNSEKE